MGLLGKTTKVLLGIFLLSLVCTPAQSQAPGEGEQSRKWDLSIWAAGATGEENRNSLSEAQIVTAGISFGRMLTAGTGQSWRAGRLEYAFDVAPLFVQLNPRVTYGIAFDPVILRWTSSLHKGRTHPYIELGGGGVSTTANLPSGATSSFNFIARGGGGILIRRRRGQALDVGCRWWHISNANLGLRNPEFNGIQVVISWHWFK